MEVTIKLLNKSDNTFDAYYADVLHYLDMTNDEFARYLVFERAESLWKKGVRRDDARKYFSGQKEKLRQSYRNLQDLNTAFP